jgi:Bacterial PH domain
VRQARLASGGSFGNGVLLLLSLWFLQQTLRQAFNDILVDRSGITGRNRLGFRRTVPWDQVRATRAKKRQQVGRVYVLDTEHGQLAFSANSHEGYRQLLRAIGSIPEAAIKCDQTTADDCRRALRDDRNPPEPGG